MARLAEDPRSVGRHPGHRCRLEAADQEPALDLMEDEPERSEREHRQEQQPELAPPRSQVGGQTLRRQRQRQGEPAQDEQAELVREDRERSPGEGEELGARLTAHVAADEGPGGTEIGELEQGVHARIARHLELPERAGGEESGDEGDPRSLEEPGEQEHHQDGERAEQGRRQPQGQRRHAAPQGGDQRFDVEVGAAAQIDRAGRDEGNAVLQDSGHGQRLVAFVAHQAEGPQIPQSETERDHEHAADADPFSGAHRRAGGGRTRARHANPRPSDRCSRG